MKSIGLLADIDEGGTHMRWMLFHYKMNFLTGRR
jgi:hypothetical protein